jgi:hypothetical protein
MPKQPSDQYSEQEAKSRFEAALRGARVAGHKPKEIVTRKKLQPQPRKKSERRGK